MGAGCVPDEVIDDAIDLRQQFWHLCRVLLMAFRCRGGDNLTLGIHSNVQFLLAFGFLLTVLVGMPFPLTTDLQATAIHDQEYRSRRSTIDLLSDRHGGMASRQRRVIGARQRHIHELQDRAKKPFGLAQGQMKE
jgi:hypothetical protein